MRGDPDIQFEPIPPPEAPEPPAWLAPIGEFLTYIFSFVARAFIFAWPVLQWVLVAAGVALLVLLIARIVGVPVLNRRTKAEDEEKVDTAVVVLESMERKEKEKEKEEKAKANEDLVDIAVETTMRASVGASPTITTRCK